MATLTTMPVQAAPQMAAAEPSTPMSIDQLIIEEHNKVRLLFAQYAATTAADQKQMLAYMLIREISMHACKEEEVMYPVIGKVFGAEAHMHCLEQHRSFKLKLEQLNNMSMLTQQMECDVLVAAIQMEFEQHGMEEETREIPRLLQAPGIDPYDLGAQFQQAALRAKTRPHPGAPDTPPQNIEMAPMLSEADRKADMERFGSEVPVVSFMPPVTPPSTTAM